MHRAAVGPRQSKTRLVAAVATAARALRGQGGRRPPRSAAAPPPPQFAQGNPSNELHLLQPQLLQLCTCPVVTRSSAAACMAHVRGHATCGAACGSRTSTASVAVDEALGGVGHGRGSSPPVRRQSWRHGVLSTRRPCAGGPEGRGEVAREACGYESSRARGAGVVTSMVTTPHGQEATLPVSMRGRAWLVHPARSKAVRVALSHFLPVSRQDSDSATVRVTYHHHHHASLLTQQ
jgi:hypothetical protein